ncbi:Crp/Fnr family transcriptional regulator [Flavobacterium salilacus subsp. salilacus]|uniref:Crp/Fnr family transcriptional regulator n=1 Tax=Flavobacterium TaxID=237 RepID=UPI0010752386|nr:MULTISPECIES: Crp/Fnr family transcriptional regulator [Flavobacterium]KAF2519583.1 Crp/Fnr family transcriptional regulator [Flavobacterium salilacus subsp. salilacus]MBE1614515.1 Crp/Fnr family transcriptional regulator [Flavobacterium sp. SaA2.13]NDI98425.1 Crp/Fnr family transcriptional regulator [Flavobacterium salilacus subsp. altitudinum]
MLEQLKIFSLRFCELSTEELGKLAALFSPTPVKRLDHLFTEGDMINKLFFISDGVCRGYYLKDGTECTTNFYFGPSIMTDLIAVRTKKPSSLNVQALKNSQCYTADFENIEDIIFKYPNVYTMFFKMIEHLFMEKTKREVSFIYDSPEERYIKLFSERPKVIAEIPQQYIASYIGIKPETLSRIRKKIL